MRPQLPRLAACALVSSLLACGSPEPEPPPAQTCATPTPPDLPLRDCGPGEPPTLSVREYACADDGSGPFSLVRRSYPQLGQTFLYRDGVTMLAADGRVPDCWTYRGVDAAESLGCPLKYSWTRCASASPGT